MIERHTSPQVPSIFAVTETHFRSMFSTLSEEACFSRRSWEILRLRVVKGGCGFLFLLYKLALHLSCLYSRCYTHSVASGKYAVKKRNSNQCLGRKIARTKKRFLLRVFCTLNESFIITCSFLFCSSHLDILHHLQNTVTFIYLLFYSVHGREAHSCYSVHMEVRAHPVELSFFPLP